jgi:hypothetical protein
MLTYYSYTRGRAELLSSSLTTGQTLVGTSFSVTTMTTFCHSVSDLIKGQCHEIFLNWFSSNCSFWPQETWNGTISIFFEYS